MVAPEAVPDVSARVMSHDARWYPVDMDLAHGRYAMLRISEETVERSAFMDLRIDADLSQARVVSFAELGDAEPLGPPPGWLLHTSFCCSTLLARALNIAPKVVALKEPQVLRRLSDARRNGQEFDRWVVPTVGLLSRPWCPDGRVVVKPTHGALNIAAKLLDASPGSRAVVVTSSLDDFLVSHFKKTPETLTKVPELCERAASASPTAKRLPAGAFAPPSLLAAVGLQWAVQRELLLDIAREHDGRLRVVDSQQLLDDLPGVAERCVAWWGFDVDAKSVRSRARDVSGSHAKVPGRAYTAKDRLEESRVLRQAYAEEFRVARRWAEEAVLPHLRPEALNLSAGALALGQ